MFFTFLVVLVVAIAVMSAFTSNLKDPKIAPKIKPFNYPAVEKVSNTRIYYFLERSY